MIRNLLSDLYHVFTLSFGLAVFIVVLAVGMYFANFTIEVVEKMYKDSTYKALENEI